MADEGCRRIVDRRDNPRVIHRTRPLIDADGNLIGHGCDCGRHYTPRHGLSEPRKLRPDGITEAPSKAHEARVKASRRGIVRRWLSKLGVPDG